MVRHSTGALLIAASALLQACGGGGEADAEAGHTAVLHVSPESISVTSTVGYYPADGIVVASLTNPPHSTVYVGFEQTSNAVSYVDFAVLDKTSAQVNVHFQYVGTGVYHDTVVIHVCYDIACHTEVGNSPFTLPVTLIVNGPHINISADPTSGPVGSSTQLTWTTDGSSCSASGDWSGSKATSGSETVVISKAGSNTFYLGCDTPYGYGNYSVEVTGVQATVSLAATETTVGTGQSTTLNWSTTHASQCTASGNWSGSRAVNGSETVTPSAPGDYTYTLTCSDPSSASGSQSVVVHAVDPNLALFAFPSIVGAGQPYTVKWNAKYAQDCVASGAWSGAQAMQGSTTKTAGTSGSTDYTLTCSNAGATTAQTVTVTVGNPPALPPAPAYMVNPQHDGFATFTAGITLPATSSPAWSRNLGATVSYPLIADGRVYVATENPTGGYGNRLYALNAATGETIWGPVTLAGTYSSTGIAFENGRIFTLNFDGNVRAFDAATGALLWSGQMPGYWHDADPVAYGGVLFATGNGGTVAWDEATGTKLWSNGSYGNNACPAVTADGLYLETSSVNMAFNPATGATLWTASVGGGWGADVAVRNGKVFARNADSNLYIYDQSTGNHVRTLYSGRAMAVTDSIMATLYLGTLSGTGVSDGQQKWTFTGDGGLVTAPIVVNDVVFIGSSSGNVYALDIVDGSTKWVGKTAALSAPDQWNQHLVTGPGAGEGYYVMSGGSTVAAWHLQ